MMVSRLLEMLIAVVVKTGDGGDVVVVMVRT